jgi:hypothetical protein
MNYFGKPQSAFYLPARQVHLGSDNPLPSIDLDGNLEGQASDIGKESEPALSP